MDVLTLVYAHPWITGIFLILIGEYIEAAIKAVRRCDEDGR